MSRLISVKLEDSVFELAEKFVRQTGVNRNTYINTAVRFFNRLQTRRSCENSC